MEFVIDGNGEWNVFLDAEESAEYAAGGDAREDLSTTVMHEIEVRDITSAVHVFGDDDSLIWQIEETEEA